ncbi:hypothetical protein [Streptomyces sp. CNQ085]|uniref:hypothetical protein n=1 Tax=Streptomyces sp. CNQ085 TaxID=2886944 RepID=UPI001F50BBCC|nr:hypothetical protein [Streptomyces sp. CNQ085]MCI0384588.1 hypothetical protein [Streptomyces sp. CNQ085]
MAATVTVTLPVFMRIGEDGEEIRVGEVTADSALEMQHAVPELLREYATALEEHLTRPGRSEGGGP